MVIKFRPRSSPWHVDDSEFYELQSFEEEMRFLLRFAVLAPSGHNTQPWSFRVTPDGVEVYADYTRRLAIVDPADRELLMSIGAAIANLRVAAAHFGFDTSVLYETRPEESLPVALITVRETCAPEGGLGHLFQAIKERHTNRRRFSTQPIEPQAMAAVRAFLGKHRDVVELITAPQEKQYIAHLIEKGDYIQMGDPGFRKELAAWIRPNAAGDPDGIPGDALAGVPDALSNAAPWVVEHVNPAAIQARQDRKAAETAPALIIVKANDDRVHLLQAGEVLELLLLTLTLHGVQYAFMNQAIEVETLRGRLASMLTTDEPPQLLFRVGYAPPVSRPAPRRPLESVLT
jgi:hypothetical protein